MSKEYKRGHLDELKPSEVDKFYELKQEYDVAYQQFVIAEHRLTMFIDEKLG